MVGSRKQADSFKHVKKFGAGRDWTGWLEEISIGRDNITVRQDQMLPGWGESLNGGVWLHHVGWKMQCCITRANAAKQRHASTRPTSRRAVVLSRLQEYNALSKEMPHEV